MTAFRKAYGVVGAVAIARVGAGATLGFRPFDDSFITFRYARNLVEGYGFTYNAGEFVLGTTTPLWTLVLAAASAVGLPLPAFSLWFALVADGISALLLCRLLLRLNYSPIVGAAASILFLAFFDALSLARSGMEVSLFTLCTVATLAALEEGASRRAALFCGLAMLTRPEGVVLAGVLAISLWITTSGRRPVARWLGPAAVLAAVVVPWVLYAIVTFGSPVPQSVVAKAATAGDSQLRAFSRANILLFFYEGQYGGDIFERTLLQLTPLLTLLAAIGALALLLDARRGPEPMRLRAVLLLLFPFGYVGGLALSNAFTFFPWYYGPIYPFMAALAAVGAGRAGELLRRPSSIVAGTGSVLVCAQLAAACYVKLPADHDFWGEGYERVSSAIPVAGSLTLEAK